ncbi:MAG: RNA 2',3'-cyclic phosphodiesterase [Planctomycetes bacterium]|nr:RNA 2',3'-cyclic phosphodiesterase [Planctomycetota bacterium]
MSARPRLFVALMLGRELGEPLVRAVDAALGAVAVGDGARPPGLRRYAPADLHLTLFFLGATASDSIEPLSRALGALSLRHGPFDLRVTRAGAFPARGKERVLWLGVDEARAGGLERLAADVADACTALGARAEARPWRAHVTVARARERTRVRVRVPERFFDLDPGLGWKPTRLQLVESLAGRERAEGERERYRVVADFALATR